MLCTIALLFLVITYDFHGHVLFYAALVLLMMPMSLRLGRLIFPRTDYAKVEFDSELE